MVGVAVLRPKYCKRTHPPPPTMSCFDFFLTRTGREGCTPYTAKQASERASVGGLREARRDPHFFFEKPSFLIFVVACVHAVAVVGGTTVSPMGGWVCHLACDTYIILAVGSDVTFYDTFFG